MAFAMRSARQPRWPYLPPGTAERTAHLQAEVQQIISERQRSTAKAAGPDGVGTWREFLAAESITSPQRVTPRFRCKTPRDGGPLYVDKPIPVPLPPGAQHVSFKQRVFWGDATGAYLPPNPRRLPTAMPSPRAEPGPTWESKPVEHIFCWRF